LTAKRRFADLVYGADLPSEQQLWASGMRIDVWCGSRRNSPGREQTTDVAEQESLSRVCFVAGFRRLIVKSGPGKRRIAASRFRKFFAPGIAQKLMRAVS
jgi:hypothetical protein